MFSYDVKQIQYNKYFHNLSEKQAKIWNNVIQWTYTVVFLKHFFFFFFL